MTLPERMKGLATKAQRDAMVLYLAGRDPRVPWYAKVLAAAAAAYAFSPIDLIPDFIPVIGYFDDILLLPLAIAAAMRLIPPAVMADLCAEADRRLAAGRPSSLIAAATIIILWLAVCALSGWAVYAVLS